MFHHFFLSRDGDVRFLSDVNINKTMRTIHTNFNESKVIDKKINCFIDLIVKNAASMIRP